MTLPLSRLRMIDLSRQLPGPFCSMLLADFGVDVLAIANPTDPMGIGIPFLARNKRHMRLNLKNAAGRDILLRLVDDADIVLEGYRPGVPARLGIDYDTLRARNPRLIYCSISGYGQDGPYRDRVGHDINYLGYAGVLNFVGEAGGPPVIPGVQIADIRSALYSAFGERQVSTIYTSSDSYQVIMQVPAEDRADESAFGKIYVRGKNGSLVSLSSIATVERKVGPLSINHTGQLNAVTVSFNLAPGAALGDASKLIEKFKRELNLPVSILTSYGGDAAAFQSSQSSQIILIVIALLVIYVLLGVLYESYIHPITILSGLPSAAAGALAMLWLFNIDLSIIAMIGILMLIGIVKKNAIMMIDFALNAQRNQGMAPREAIRTASLLRFRPIMMTTSAALMGALPIAIGFGAGAELRQPLGLAVVGGLLFSQVITLFITPVIYLYLDRFSGSGPLKLAGEA